ncbi:MAG: hypothetical protein AAF630_05015 [Cyanobacteria bacterium P01_C01_bin.38]
MGETPKNALFHQLPTTNYQLPIPTPYQICKHSLHPGVEKFANSAKNKNESS